MLMFALLLALGATNIFAQQGAKTTFSVHGIIHEQTNMVQTTPLAYAVVSIKDYSLHTTTDKSGAFNLSNVPSGRATLSVMYLGKVAIDTMINVKGDINIELVMQDDNFRVKEVVVTAQNNKAGQSTASNISRTAMDHLQATSLKDVLSLMPGGITRNQNLSFSGQITIRDVSTASTSNSVSDQSQLNAMGVAIIQDGSPMSNNANLQKAPGLDGATTGATGSVPGGGVDVRGISVENIESIEVIRGIASAQYGDLTSGAVVIHSKAGREPLKINVKTNPNLYQFAAAAGYNLGERHGALNFSADYAHNVNDPAASYRYYDRFSGKLLYSNIFFRNRLRSNTSVDFLYGKMAQERNPDDTQMSRAYWGKDRGVKLTTNGMLTFKDAGWLKNIYYVASANYMARDSWSQQGYSNAGVGFSTTLVDGAVVSNNAATDVYDKDGNKITNIPASAIDDYAYYLPSSYVGNYNIEGREINLYGKVTATLFKKWGELNNRIVLGADAKSDGNEGKGLTFDYPSAPRKDLTVNYGSHRQKNYSAIPYINQLGLFAEENLSYALGKHKITLQAGVRYDKVSVAGGLVSPRVNLGVDVIPGWLTLRGGYGIQGKMPTLLYLYPDAVYFDMVNVNTYSNPAIDQKILIATTRIFDPHNADLEIAKNRKAEIGFDLKYGKYKLAVTAYDEKMDNGYMMSNTLNTFKHAQYDNYAYNTADGTLGKTATYDVLLKYMTPTNNRVLNSRGVEFDLNLGRFDAIRTAVAVNGAWMRTESYNKEYSFYDGRSGEAANQTHVGVYQQEMEKHYWERATTSVRLTHNIPEIGFVVTLTVEATWKDSDWYKYGNDSIPVMYISKFDGQVYDFPVSRKDEQEFNTTLRTVTKMNYVRQDYPALFCFNINVTKEIRDVMRVSFFANNMFRYYQYDRDYRSTSYGYTKRNPNFFFGLELSLKIK